MKTTINAYVAADAISFPDKIAIKYLPTDGHDALTGLFRYCYSGEVLTWEQTKLRFMLDVLYAKECEGYFASGQRVLLRQATDIEGEWEDPPRQV